MTTYVIRIVSHVRIISYMIEAKDLLSAKEIAEEKFHKENPTETIVRMELDNPDYNKVGEILDLLKERL